MSTPVPVLISLDNDDRLVGGEDHDALYGDGGSDTLVGGLGRDTLSGGRDDDLVIGGGARIPFEGIQTSISEENFSGIFYFNRPDPLTFAEHLLGGEGNDTIVGGSWDDSETADGVLKEDEIDFGKLELQESWGFNNVIWGGAGNDLVYGANGFDTIGGGDGDDTLRGYDAPDILYGGDGDDIIFGGAGRPELFHIESGGGSTLTEQLYGGAGNDQLLGGEDDDQIYGGTGHDMLIGGEGHDTLTGGEGADVFDYFQGMDVITDYTPGEDIIGIELGLSVDQLKSQASEQTIDGMTGTLIVFGDDDGLFLAGISLADFDQISFAL